MYYRIQTILKLGACFLEIWDDCYPRRSIVLSSQLSIANRHKQIGDPTVSGSILDGLVHTAYRFELDGESMRKNFAD
jgi:hypothetical protein